VVAAIGVAGICAAVRTWLRGGKLATGLAAVLAAVALLGFGIAAGPYVRSHLLPFEQTRQQTQYVEAHAGPADLIVVSANSNWGFAYYWPQGSPATRRDLANLQLYQAVFPAQPRIIVVRERNYAQVKASMTQAMSMIRPGTCRRIWLVRTHETAAELPPDAADRARRGRRDPGWPGFVPLTQLAWIRVPRFSPSQIRRMAPTSATSKTCIVSDCSLASTNALVSMTRMPAARACAYVSSEYRTA
jgi:hypothetical protein